MRWFLKCFYGYGNLWDEMLFWGVLDYIDTTYSHVDELFVEVADVEWMQQRWTRNSHFITDLALAWWFTSQQKIVKFVEISKDIRDNFRYDIYFFGGGEVFAESRGWHWWRNYLFRYLFSICTKPFVLLGGIETPVSKLQKLLYKIVLPRAQKIICREKDSYQTSLEYNKNTILYQDFAVPLVDKFRQKILGHHTQSLTSHDPYSLHDVSRLTGSDYILINMIASMSNEDSYVLIERFIAQYPNHRLIYVACTDQDREYGIWLIGVYPDIVMYDWKQYTLAQTLWLFASAKSGIWCRLHFLLLLQELHRDRYALVYAEKVKKLIHSTIILD